MIWSILELVIALNGSSVAFQDAGRVSMYHPNDGSNGGELACGGRLQWSSHHIAYRRWWRVGCGRRVIVCSVETGRCVRTHVRDGGPYGVYRGSINTRRVASKAERRSGQPRAGWKWRGVADLTWAVWKDLGRPRFLSQISLYFLKRRTRPVRAVGCRLRGGTAHVAVAQSMGGV